MTIGLMTSPEQRGQMEVDRPQQVSAVFLGGQQAPTFWRETFGACRERMVH